MKFVITVILSLVAIAIFPAHGADNPEAEPPSIRNMQISADDLLIRIEYDGSLQLYQAWLTLKRIQGQSSAEYYAPTVLVANGVVRTLTSTTPVVSWQDLWAETVKGLFDLPGGQGICRNVVLLDGDSVTIETLQGSRYHKATYYQASENRCHGAPRLRAALRYLQEAFRGELPQPYQEAPSIPTAR